MNIAILKYPAGNIFSVQAALSRLGAESVVTDDVKSLQQADRVIIPGQGEASSTMEYLRSHRLDEIICNLKQPVLGICIGMQLMCASSEEGEAKCLDIFPEVGVRRFVAEHKEKIPHMGWNSISNLKGNLFDGVAEGSYVYFVHSYYVPTCKFSCATTTYAQPFSAAIEKNNFHAVQFHPEKSGKIGEQILRNFLK